MKPIHQNIQEVPDLAGVRVTQFVDTRLVFFCLKVLGAWTPAVISYGYTGFILRDNKNTL